MIADEAEGPINYHFIETESKIHVSTLILFFVLQDNFLFFTGNLKPIREKLLENEIVGHAFLVDSNGLVRWKAHANPTEQEITSMLDCSKLLLKETERTLRRNNKVVSNFR